MTAAGAQELPLSRELDLMVQGAVAAGAVAVYGLHSLNSLRIAMRVWEMSLR